MKRYSYSGQLTAGRAGRRAEERRLRKVREAKVEAVRLEAQEKVQLGIGNATESDEAFHARVARQAGERRARAERSKDVKGAASLWAKVARFMPKFLRRRP